MDIYDWRATRLHAYVWWCGDEACDCRQPVIELRTPNLAAGYPYDRITSVWKGTFTSGGWPEGHDLYAELAAECERRGIPLGQSEAVGSTP